MGRNAKAELTAKGSYLLTDRELWQILSFPGPERYISLKMDVPLLYFLIISFTQHWGVQDVCSHCTSASPCLSVKNVPGEERNEAISTSLSSFPSFPDFPLPSAFPIRPMGWETPTGLVSALVPPSVTEQHGATVWGVLWLWGAAVPWFLAFPLALLDAQRQLVSLPLVPRARQGTVLSWQWQSSACKVVPFLKS